MTERDYDKEKRIIKASKIREEAIASAPTMANLYHKKITTLLINDTYAGTIKEIDVSKLKKEEFLQKVTDAYNEIFATELQYIQEKNLSDGPYLHLTWKLKTSTFNIKGPGFKPFN